MTLEEFRRAFGRDIAQALGRVTRRYSVTDDDMIAAFQSAARKCLAEDLEKTTGNPGPVPATRAAVGELLSTLNCDDLCLAVACAKGDETAWEDFFREYRSYLINTARTMTQDAGAAEVLADSTFAELYGVRESGGERVSKFSFYSGRGSLRGWLRAVLYQLAADHHRQRSRFVQPEESEDMDRIIQAAEGAPERSYGEIAAVTDRYHAAVADSLGRAIQELEDRDRLLLNYYYYDELTLREIGRMFDVHEATISRWLAKVHKRARKLIEKSLARDHGFGRREVTEAMEQAAEHLDIAVPRRLVDPSEATPAQPQRRARAQLRRTRN